MGGFFIGVIIISGLLPSGVRRITHKDFKLGVFKLLDFGVVFLQIRERIYGRLCAIFTTDEAFGVWGVGVEGVGE